MSEARLLEDIRNQPASLEGVLQYQLGAGRAALAEAAANLRRARRIVLTGMGSSVFACEPLRCLLASRGISAEVVEAAELLHFLHPAAAGATVVMVSRSGETVEITKALPLISDHAAATIGVTNEPSSTLAREAQCAICVHSAADEMIAVQTYTATTLALLLLGYLTIQKPEPDWRPQIEAAIRGMRQAVERFEQESNSWRGFLEDAASIYLLARGPSVASALQGMLMLNEVAKIAATAMGAGEFRHGPVEIVDARFRALVFAPAGSAGALNIELARDLRALGGQVAAIGPHEADWTVPRVPELLAPLIEIVPVQFAALRLAEWRGFPAGQFRHGSQVTTTESGFGRRE